MSKIVSFLLSVVVSIALFIPVSVNSAANISVGGASLQLNGIAIQSELRSEWFINALYLSTNLKTSEDILADKNAKRMELKVLADKLSARRLKRFWVERIRNNNPAEDVLARVREVRNLANMLGQNLVKGDVISLDYVPNTATIISINGSQVGRLSADIYNFVLNCWIGEHPPSEGFKQAILGNSSFDGLLAQYQSIQPSAARIAVFDRAAQQKIADAKAEEKAKQLAEQQRQERLAAEQAKKRQALIDQQRRKDEERLAQAQQQEQLKQQAEAAKIAEQAAQKPIVVEVPAGPSPEEIALAKKNYTSSIRSHYVKFFSYPTKKIIRRHGSSIVSRPKEGKSHGTVAINLEVDRGGDVVGGSLASSSGERILDDAALKALFDAEPYPSMPEELEDESFETLVRIVIPAPNN